MYSIVKKSELYHHGILGMHWGVRRYQNPDGTLTAAGRRHAMNNYDYSQSDAYKNSDERGREKQRLKYRYYEKMLGYRGAQRVAYRVNEEGKNELVSAGKEVFRSLATAAAVATAVALSKPAIHYGRYILGNYLQSKAKG